IGAATTASGYDGLILRPKKLPRGVDRIPGVVVLHGLGGNKCGLWWAARLLASRRYISLVLSYPEGDTPADHGPEAVKATRSAIKYLRSPADPYRGLLLRNDLGLVGHSQGSIGASIVQG